MLIIGLRQLGNIYDSRVRPTQKGVVIEEKNEKPKY